jgi:hypothetical protein
MLPVGRGSVRAEDDAPTPARTEPRPTRASPYRSLLNSCLATAAGCSAMELDLLAEEYLARLEVRWIQEG